jgi:hypothetical protein
LRVQE